MNINLNLNTNQFSDTRKSNFITQINNINFKGQHTTIGKGIGERLIQRANSLPQNIDHIIYSTGMLLKNSINKEEYVKRFFKFAEPLYKRIALGTNKEEFINSYKAELNFVAKIKDSINKNNDKSSEIFTNNIIELSENYLKTPIQRTQYFAI